MFRVRGKHVKERAKRAPYIMVGVLIAVLVLTLLPKGEGPPAAEAPAPQVSEHHNEVERLQRFAIPEPKSTMPIDRIELLARMGEEELINELMGELVPQPEGGVEILLNRFGGVAVSLPEADAADADESEIDGEAEAALWQERIRYPGEPGTFLVPELEGAVAQSGLVERIRALKLPPHPTMEEVAEALVRLGQVPVLTHELSEDVTVVIGVHFGLTTSVHHVDYIYEPGYGRPVETRVQSLLVPHAQRMETTAPDDISDATLERLACRAHPELYLRAMLLVEHVILQETGHQVKVFSLTSPETFHGPAWLQEEIIENACFGQN